MSWMRGFFLFSQLWPTVWVLFFCLMSTFSFPQRYFTPTGRDVYFYIERRVLADIKRFIPNGSHCRLCGKISIRTNREIYTVKGKRIEWFFCLMSTFSCPQRYFTPKGRDVYFYIERILIADVQRFIPMVRIFVCAER